VTRLSFFRQRCARRRGTSSRTLLGYWFHSIWLFVRACSISANESRGIHAACEAVISF
jgi:hypothetical protein